MPHRCVLERLILERCDRHHVIHPSSLLVWFGSGPAELIRCLMRTDDILLIDRLLMGRRFHCRELPVVPGVAEVQRKRHHGATVRGQWRAGGVRNGQSLVSSQAICGCVSDGLWCFAERWLVVGCRRGGSPVGRSASMGSMGMGARLSQSAMGARTPSPSRSRRTMSPDDFRRTSTAFCEAGPGIQLCTYTIIQ